MKRKAKKRKLPECVLNVEKLFIMYSPVDEIRTSGMQYPLRRYPYMT